MRWLWMTFLVGSTLAAASGDPVVISTYSFEDPDIEASLPPGAERTQSSLDLPLPFYRYTRQRVTSDGNILEETVTQGIPFSWGMMTAFLAYVVLVVRWNPENRRALRGLRTAPRCARLRPHKRRLGRWDGSRRARSRACLRGQGARTSPRRLRSGTPRRPTPRCYGCLLLRCQLTRCRGWAGRRQCPQSKLPSSRRRSDPNRSPHSPISTRRRTQSPCTPW
jgi:hypothetical protein